MYSKFKTGLFIRRRPQIVHTSFSGQLVPSLPWLSPVSCPFRLAPSLSLLMMDERWSFSEMFFFPGRLLTKLVAVSFTFCSTKLEATPEVTASLFCVIDTVEEWGDTVGADWWRLLGILVLCFASVWIHSVKAWLPEVLMLSGIADLSFPLSSDIPNTTPSEILGSLPSSRSFSACLDFVLDWE